MASRDHHMSYSARPMSQDPLSDLYDPYDAPSDPIAMSNLPGRSINAQGSHDLRRAGSPGISPPTSPLPGYPSLRSNGTNNQYAPLGGPSRPESIAQSGAASLYSMNSLTHHKTADADAQRLVDLRAGELAEWHIHWFTPAMIVVLFVAGVAGALGHHFFYVHLDGNPAEDQLKMVRYGTALAFFTKATLVGTIIMCYRQRIWYTFRRKAMTVNAIDGLFTATEDPIHLFWNWEMIWNAKLATFMALCSWLIPIASVLSPASLTSEVVEWQNQTHCPAVASLNFSRESVYNFRDEVNFAGASLSYFNTTDRSGKTEGYFDYYDMPSKNAKRLVVPSMYLAKPTTNPNASLNSCGERWNCTYNINFEAPGYKCDEIANKDQPDSGSAPFNLSILAPQGDHTYYADVDLNDYKNPQIDTDNAVPRYPPPYPESLGVLESEPILWIGHSVKTSESYEADSPYAKWGKVHEPKIIKCVAHRTNYTFEMRFNDTVQSHILKERNFLAPIIDTELTVNPNNASDTIAAPSSNYVRPVAAELYKYTAAYHSLGSLVRDFLRGEISNNDSFIVTKSDISITRLMDANTSYPLANLEEEIPHAFEDMLIALLSDPHLAVADTLGVPCNKSRYVNIFIYHREGLWVGYAFAVGVTFVFMLVGGWSIWKNGVASDTLFSRILVTTRNPTLDRLGVGACLGGDPFPKELTKTKLRFGVLLEDDPKEGPLGRVEHCCFGAMGETKEIVKHGTYAGLKKWRKAAEEESGNASEKNPLLENLPRD